MNSTENPQPTPTDVVHSIELNAANESSPELTSATPVVTHDTNSQRFETRAIGGSVAFLHYTIAGDRIAFDHTFVPDELRGQGIAALLAHAALTEARQSGWRIVPACSYVAAYIERHSEFADLLTPFNPS